MTEYNDSGGYMTGFMEKAKHDERDDWASIPDETLEQFTVTFSFTDLKGFRFYIPAYMDWTVRNHRISHSIVGTIRSTRSTPRTICLNPLPFGSGSRTNRSMQ